MSTRLHPGGVLVAEGGESHHMRENCDKSRRFQVEWQALFAGFLCHGMPVCFGRFPGPTAPSRPIGQRHMVPVATRVHGGSGKVKAIAWGRGIGSGGGALVCRLQRRVQPHERGRSRPTWSTHWGQPQLINFRSCSDWCAVGDRSLLRGIAHGRRITTPPPGRRREQPIYLHVHPASKADGADGPGTISDRVAA